MYVSNKWITSTYGHSDNINVSHYHGTLALWSIHTTLTQHHDKWCTPNVTQLTHLHGLSWPSTHTVHASSTHRDGGGNYCLYLPSSRVILQTVKMALQLWIIYRGSESTALGGEEWGGCKIIHGAQWGNHPHVGSRCVSSLIDPVVFEEFAGDIL